MNEKRHFNLIDIIFYYKLMVLANSYIYVIKTVNFINNYVTGGPSWLATSNELLFYADVANAYPPSRYQEEIRCLTKNRD